MLTEGRDGETIAPVSEESGSVREQYYLLETARSTTVIASFPLEVRANLGTKQGFASMHNIE